MGTSKSKFTLRLAGISTVCVTLIRPYLRSIAGPFDERNGYTRRHTAARHHKENIA
jgi:hypothetical protein